MPVSNAAAAVSSMDFKKCRKFHVFLVLALVFVISCSVSYKWSISGRRQEAVRGNVTILVWHWPFGQTSTLQKDACWDNYHVPGCNLVDNRSLLSQADVVIYHNRELQNGVSKLPLDLPRPPAQKWVWLSLESPAHNGDLRQYGGLFNWTMTYQSDADICLPYGELIPRTTKGNYTIPAKQTLACWVVSNFQSSHKRSEVYMSLKNLIPVEVYGHWAKKPLNNEQVLPIISQCYFYLAFENSVYRDYITEKLWYNAFLAGTVPVVLGPPRANYEAYIPKDSFIHVDDFASITELATFLNELASHKERYNSYFRWRSDYYVKRFHSWSERFCKICKIYERLPPRKIYDDLDSWSRHEP
ncbi:alpha-(1,3)-fucosyltransferase 7-like isoform X2 [Brienomyrus brachyistius]|uniref:alpha-(1,3)-fucosyltransferase 7-like isoform X2 n=1 Tax=Brienomyrus brachyistius TaxID=42636 RepID=UPI0020B2F479|nr:alpha-(1,3)-fucosyltransferase 7-like isoform X2 [Brienomyrus brachyistius]